MRAMSPEENPSELLRTLRYGQLIADMDGACESRVEIQRILRLAGERVTMPDFKMEMRRISVWPALPVAANRSNDLPPCDSLSY